ncbi:MAG: ChaN family lipoprotein, partial [Candidatus Aminicenantales bacterium]
DQMIRDMKSSRLVYVGESHNSLPMHEIQFQVLRALYAQDRNLAVGMEMLPVTVQETLDKWTSGILTKDEFIREVRWYVNWNFNYGFYEKIFDFAKEHRLPVYALNVPREIITKIRMQGWDGLTDEEKKFIPKAPDLTNQDHRALIRKIFESSEIPHQMKGAGLDMMFEGLYRGQSAWDEVMSANAVKGAESEGRRLVVCAGSGHLLYNLGLNMRAFEKSGLPSTTVIVVAVPAGQRSLKVSRTYGDYVFGIAEEAKPAFPSVGLALKKVENLENLVVESKPIDGAASRSDFEKGDIILSVDGRAYGDINEARTYMARFKCGDEIKFRILRGGQAKDVLIKFDKCPPAATEPADKKK